MKVTLFVSGVTNGRSAKHREGRTGGSDEDDAVRKSLRAGAEWHMFGLRAEDNDRLVVFEYPVRVQDES